MNTTARVIPKSVLWVMETGPKDLIHMIATKSAVAGEVETAVCGKVLHPGAGIDMKRPLCQRCAVACGWTITPVEQADDWHRV